MPRPHGLLLLALAAAFAAPDVSSATDTIDPSRAKAEAGGSILWYDLRDLNLEGRGRAETKAPYDRLPAKAEGVVRGPVWNLSRHSAGLCARFVTDATTIYARWTLASNQLAMPHMPATGVSGLDLYAWLPKDGRWQWLGVGQPTQFPTNSGKLISGLSAGKREFLLYLPLYNGVSSVEIGIPRECTLAGSPARTRERQKPIVFYGTSITQGGCASRPGMVHTAILGRRLDRPVINLGFSGNGRMDLEVAKLLAELDAAVYVIDCLPNMSANDVEERAESFVRTLLKARPQTPILLVEDRTYANAPALAGLRQRQAASRAALRKVFEKVNADTASGVHYLVGDKLLGDDGEATVDGSHPTDLGFVRQADAFLPALAPLLPQPEKPNVRKPASEAELRYWLENMVWYHQFTTAEVAAATGLTAEEVAESLKKFAIAPASKPKRSADAFLFVLPYPGGRHPRIGFLDGAVRPQRETKVSVFTPWDENSYVVVDVPEAIWSNLGLTYLAHTHVPTIWTKQGIELEPLEWNRHADGSLDIVRKLPNGIAFGAKVKPMREAIRMELWLTNGTKEQLTDLRVQNCVMLKGARGFERQTSDNKVSSSPYVACRSKDGKNWVITAWEPCHRAWDNPQCPCLHSDPKFPDCAPGQTVRVRGWLSFYEGTDIHAEFRRIDRTGQRGN